MARQGNGLMAPPPQARVRNGARGQAQMAARAPMTGGPATANPDPNYTQSQGFTVPNNMQPQPPGSQMRMQRAQAAGFQNPQQQRQANQANQARQQMPQQQPYQPQQQPQPQGYPWQNGFGGAAGWKPQPLPDMGFGMNNWNGQSIIPYAGYASGNQQQGGYGIDPGSQMSPEQFQQRFPNGFGGYKGPGFPYK